MERILVYNPMYDKIPQNSVLQNGTVRFEVRIEKSYAQTLKGINFVLRQDGAEPVKFEMEKLTSLPQYARYMYMHTFENTGVFWYYFEIVESEKTYFLQQSEDLNAASCDEVSNPFMQLVTVEQPESEGFCGGVMYHIFVDRFCAKDVDESLYKGKVLRKDWGGEVNSYIGQKEVLNNEFYGGNFEGIISKLDYLKTLGVTTIYLSPICKAFSNHKYDIGDYMEIAEEFGGEEGFKKLIAAAKEKGIGIIIDAVLNHTGSDSRYFNKKGSYDSVGAYQSKNSPYYSWYNFTNYPDKYDCWWSVKILPQIRKESIEFQNFICDEVLPKYLKLGVQGFRFDVIDELKSDFVDRIRETVNKYNDKAVLIGEVWEDASNKIAYGERKKYFENGQLNSVMNYPLKDAIIKYCLDEDENALVYVIRMLKDHYPKQVQSHMMNIIGTHDTMRILSVLSLGCDRRDSSYKKKDTVVPAKLRIEGLRRLKIASLLQFTTVGVPCIYYGDEAGLTGDNDPFNRKCFPWDNINKSIYEWYKDLGRLRQNPAFCGGDVNVLYSGEGVVVYDRVLDNDRVLVLINNSKNPFPARIDNEMKNFETGELFQGDLVMDPYTFLIFEKV